MDIIFAKAAPSPSHHYSRLLRRSSKPTEAASTEEFFAVKPPSSPHLYTPRGIVKGHRRTNSELPPESPSSIRSGHSVLSRTTEKSHSELSAELMTSLHSRLEGIVGQLDSSQRQDLTELIEKLQAETQMAKADATLLKQETEQMKVALQNSDVKRQEAEARCARLQQEVEELTRENREYEVRVSEIPRGMLQDSLSLSFEREVASETVSTLQRELREKTLENTKLHQLLTEATRELKSLKSRTSPRSP